MNNKEKKKEEEQVDEEENKENGKEITTTMQSSAAMQQRCTGGQGKCLFLSRERGGGGDQNYDAVFLSNGSKLYSWAKAIFCFQ